MFKDLITKRIIILLIITASLLYYLSQYLCGISVVDNWFWINESRFWDESPMSILSLWSMHLWHSLFGYTLLSNRILAMFLNLLSVVVPYTFVLNKYERNKYIYYLLGAIVTMGPGIMKCCNPDVFTSFFASILLVHCIKTVKAKGSIYEFLYLGAITALCIASRFPNILFVLIITAFIFIIKTKKRLLYASSYLIFTLFLYWCIMYVLLGTTDVFQALSNELGTELVNSNGRHSIIGLLLRYCKSIALGVVALILLACIWYLNKKEIIKNKTINSITTIIVGSLITYSVYSHIGLAIHSWMVCLVCFDIAVLLYLSIMEYKNKNYTRLTTYLVLIIFALIPSAGSDTGFFKSLIVACALMPLLVCFVSEHVKNLHIINILYVMIIITSIGISSERMLNMTHQSNIQVLKGIYLEKAVVESYEKSIENIKPYFVKDHTVFYGYQGAHSQYVITETKPLYHYGFWMEKNDTIALRKAIAALDQNPKNVLFDYMKSDEHFFTERGLYCIAHKNDFNVYKCK